MLIFFVCLLSALCWFRWVEALREQKAARFWSSKTYLSPLPRSPPHNIYLLLTIPKRYLWYGSSVLFCHLTLKAPLTTAADNTHKYVFIVFSEKIRLDCSSESSARHMKNQAFVRERIHMKNQALFSSKDKSNKLKCRLLQFLFGVWRFKG